MNTEISRTHPQTLLARLEEAECKAKERLDSDVRSIQGEFRKRGVDTWEASPEYLKRIGQRYRQYEYEVRSMLDQPMLDLSDAGVW